MAMKSDEIRAFLDTYRVGDRVWVEYDAGKLRRTRREYSGYLMMLSTAAIGLDQNPRRKAYDVQIAFGRIRGHGRLRVEADLEARAADAAAVVSAQEAPGGATRTDGSSRERAQSSLDLPLSRSS